MKIKIWGSRGCRPVTGVDSLKYGGDTMCAEILLDNGESILIDAGTGIIPYDKATAKDRKSRALCMTHTHSAHIQGLPFFSGTTNRQAPFLIMGPGSDQGTGFEEGLKQFFDGIHVPIKWSDLPPHKVVEVNGCEKFELFGAILETCPTIHRGGCIAWKITADGWTFAMTGDHEIPLNKSNTDRNIQNEKLMGFLAGSDIVLADGYWTREQHEGHPESGHSSPGQWLQELADRSVGKVFFTHLNPDYNDRMLASLLAEAEEGPLPGALVFDGAIITRDGLAGAPAATDCPSCEFSRKVAAYSDTHSIVDALLTSTRELANAEGGTVYLVAGGELNFAAAQNDKLFPGPNARKYNYFNSRLPLTRSSIAGYVASTGKTLNIEDVYNLPPESEFEFNQALDKSSGYRTTSVLAVPLTNGQGNTVGVLQLINARGFNGYAPFGERLAEKITGIAQTATIPLERSFLVVAMILRLLKTAALRDPAETPGHVQRVGSIAAELYHHWAAKKKVDPEEILFTKGQLRLAAMLHDVGKVGVPDAILNKPGKLTEHERMQMEKHAYMGANLFGNSDNVIDSMARDIALHHHARWDGDGYTGRHDIASPGGTDIPIWARITAIADAYDAMVSPRPFRRSWTTKEATAFLRQEAGRQFDPDLVENFREIRDIISDIRARFPDTGQKY